MRMIHLLSVRRALLMSIAAVLAAMATLLFAAWAPVAADGGKPPPGAVVVSTAMGPFGRVLVTGSGMTLYMFSGDAFPFSPTGLQLPCTPLNKAPSGTSCTVPWPPLLASGPLFAEGGVHQADLGTVTRDGVTQVTYYGHPLYGFVRDTAPGQENGENVAAFNGIFWLVSADGIPDAGQATVDTEFSSNGIVLSAPTAGGVHRTLYLLTYDRQGQTTCLFSTGCGAIWPPLLTTRFPIAGPGVNRALLGVIRRPDGGLQVTYAGHPVYFFAFDLGPGAPGGLTNGEDFADSKANGVWYTVSPDGLPDPGQVTVTSETADGNSILAVVSGFVGTDVTLYAFSADTPSASACSNSCAVFWPPVLTSSPPAAGGGAAGSLLGTIQRPDGTFQVTYAGHPLYFFSHGLDSGTSGAGVTAFGGTFQVIGTSGMVG